MFPKAAFLKIIGNSADYSLMCCPNYNLGECKKIAPHEEIGKTGRGDQNTGARTKLGHYCILCKMSIDVHVCHTLASCPIGSSRMNKLFITQELGKLYEAKHLFGEIGAKKRKQN